MAGESLPTRIAEWAGTGRTYYVDGTLGSDGFTEPQARDTEANPWQTMQKAVDTFAFPGTGDVRILWKGGTYRKPGTSSTVQATVAFSSLGARTPSAAHILHILAYPGQTPIVQEPDYTGASPGSAESHGLWLDDSSAKFIRFRGLKVEQNTPKLNQHQAFRIDTTVTDIEIDDCELVGWKALAGVSPRAQGVYSEADRLHVLNCYGHDIGNSATEAAGASHPVYIASGSDDCWVHNGLFVDNRNGFGIQVFSGGSGGTGHLITHNTIAHNSMSGVVVDGAFTVAIRNNTIYANDQYAITCRGGATITSRYNHTNANGFAGSLGDGYEQVSGTHTVSNKITGVPNFVNYASRDFHLTSSSPMKNAGDIAYTSSSDFDAASRTKPDIGAFALGLSLVAATDGSLTLPAATDGSLTLSAAVEGSLTLAAASDGSLTLPAATDGSLTLTPA